MSGSFQTTVGLMLDLQVRRRFARMRQSFATLGFSSGGAKAGTDLMFDDSSLAPPSVERPHGVEWQSRAEAGGQDDALDGITTQSREAVFRLAYSIRREAEILDDLAPRARTEARRLLREDSDLAAALEAIGEEGVDAAIDLVAPPIAALVSEIATTALGISLAAVRASASARGFGHAAREIADLAAILDTAGSEADALVVSLEERSAETAALASALRRRGAAVVHDRRGDGSPPTFASLRHMTRDTAETALRIAHSADEMALSVRALAEHLITLVRRSPLGDRRAEERVQIDVPCEMRLSGFVLHGRACDLSPTGALVRLSDDADLGPGHPVTLHLPDVPSITGSIVGTEGRDVRLAFDMRLDANAAAKAALGRLTG